MDLLEAPNAATLESIKKELKEDSDRFENNLRLLEEWMDCQPHLPKNYDKRMLPIYLRGCKHDMEKVKRKIELYFVIKCALPDQFFNRDPERADIISTLDVCDVSIMPKLTPEGYRITFSKLKTPELAKFNLELIFTRGSMSTCLRTVLEHPIAGDIMVYDSSNVTAAHVATFLTPVVRRVIVDGPEAYPNRVRQIHILSAPPIVDKMVAMIKSLLKEKLRNRFHVHSSPEGILKWVPAECVPIDYGGTAESMEVLSKKTHDFVLANADWLKEQEDVKLQGPLPEKYCYEEEYGTGAVGSFRKLEVD